MRLLKGIGISFLVFVLIVSIAFWYVFTPENLTPIVNKQAKKHLSCQTNIEAIEPTFFSSFPVFGIELSNVSIISGVTNSDTLLTSKRCFVAVDVIDYLFNENITLNSLSIENGNLNFKIDSSGYSNFDDLVKPSDTQEKDTSTAELGKVDIRNVSFHDINVQFTDASKSMKANIENLTTNIDFLYDEQEQFIDLDLQLDQLQFTTTDSTALHLDVNGISFNLNSKGEDKNWFESDIKLICESVLLSQKEDTLLSNLMLVTNVPVDVNLSKNSFDLNHLKFSINEELSISINGKITTKGDSVISNIDYSTNTLDLEKTIVLIPDAFSMPLKGLIAKGDAQLSGSIEGVLYDTIKPLISTQLEYNNGTIKYENHPSVNNIHLSVSTLLDLNKIQTSKLNINSFKANVKNSSVAMKGAISDILNVPTFDINSDGNFNLSDFKSYIPKDQNLTLNGLLKGNFHAKFSQADIDNEAYHRIYLKANYRTQNLKAVYNDSMKVDLPLTNIDLSLPKNRGNNKDLTLANISIAVPSMHLEVDSTTKTNIKNLELSIAINNLVKGVSSPIINCQYKVGNLNADYDTLSVQANQVNGQLKYAPELIDDKEHAIIQSTLSSIAITVERNDTLMFNAKNWFTEANVTMSDSQSNVLDQWKPELAIRFDDAHYNINEQLNGQIAEVNCSFDSDSMIINKLDLTIADSDYKLSGELANISNYLSDDGLLEGDFNLISKNTDVYQLMEIADGFGSEEDTIVVTEEPTTTEDDPFMVPKGVDFNLNINVDRTVVNGNIIEDIKGGLTIKDGTLVLNQMGFTNQAAHMQLTALYRSDRKNHIYTGIDFHLLDINVEELIAFMPSVDTLVPMLKSFKGKGEFHLAGEVYLKSDYSLKESTIRGAAAFEGQQLKVLDSETFDMISSKLKFEKKTENIIDSLSVEMTLFKNEVDLYPFLIVMDDYKVVISGRHTMNNRFKYHISIVETPLPVRLGLDVSGTIEDLDYKLVPCQYKHLYNPKKQGKLEERTLRLKKLISESLKENVKPVE